MSSSHPKPVNETLFGNTVFVDTIKRDYTGLGWALNPIGLVSIKDRRKDRHIRKGHMMRGWMQLQTKEHKGWITRDKESPKVP